MAKVIMVQGTMSNAGKTFLCAGLCRVFKQDGYKVAPFKSQNMALNSYITREGLEMGRAQVMQAEAAGIEPEVSMNPILLKPTTDMGSQVIVNGEVWKNMTAKDYFAYKTQLIPEIMAAYRKLDEKYDIIVIEGAGSPAEINLKQDDIVNMGMAKLADAPVILVGDIDRGGVFAQLYGTVALLEQEERERIVGLVINKFRGDVSLLDSGLTMLEELCGIPVLGVLPYTKIDLDDEDSLSERLLEKQIAPLDIAVIRFPKIANFTDFNALSGIPGAGVRYVEKVSELAQPDMIILPGSKNTIQDICWMRQNGLEAAIKQQADKGTLIFGICGGYQMLGRTIADPEGVETATEEIGAEIEKMVDTEAEKAVDIEKGKVVNTETGNLHEVSGLCLLENRTVLQKEKIRTRIEGRLPKITGVYAPLSEARYEGYEIHMGITTREGQQEHLLCDYQNNVFGTYMHGIFDSEEIRKAICKMLAERKGIPLQEIAMIPRKQYKEQQYDLLAAHVRNHLNMEAVYRVMGLPLLVTRHP